MEEKQKPSLNLMVEKVRKAESIFTAYLNEFTDGVPEIRDNETSNLSQTPLKIDENSMETRFKYRYDVMKDLKKFSEAYMLKDQAKYKGRLIVAMAHSFSGKKSLLEYFEKECEFSYLFPLFCRENPEDNCIDLHFGYLTR